MDNQKSQLYLLGVAANTDIPLLMKMLATPRLDGQQRVIHLISRLAMKILDAISQVRLKLNIFLNLKNSINNLLFRISAILPNLCHNPSTSSAIAISCQTICLQEVRKKMRKRVKH
jgi:hypothetical protein